MVAIDAACDVSPLWPVRPLLVVRGLGGARGERGERQDGDEREASERVEERRERMVSRVYFEGRRTRRARPPRGTGPPRIGERQPAPIAPTALDGV